MDFIEEYGGKGQTVIVETDKWSVVRVLENDVCVQDGSQDFRRSISEATETHERQRREIVPVVILVLRTRLLQLSAKNERRDIFSTVGFYMTS